MYILPEIIIKNISLDDNDQTSKTEVQAEYRLLVARFIDHTRYFKEA